LASSSFFFFSASRFFSRAICDSLYAGFFLGVAFFAGSFFFSGMVFLLAI
jgi:hypothetical protein